MCSSDLRALSRSLYNHITACYNALFPWMNYLSDPHQVSGEHHSIFQMYNHNSSAGNKSWSQDIVWPNFENILQILHYGMIGHDDCTIHLHILCYLLQSVVNQ